jgi:hypothetical protein
MPDTSDTMTLLSLVAILQLSTLQLDIKTAFLNAKVEQTIFVKPVYDQVFVLKLVLLTLTDMFKRAKVAGQIRDLQAGGILFY